LFEQIIELSFFRKGFWREIKNRMKIFQVKNENFKTDSWKEMNPESEFHSYSMKEMKEEFSEMQKEVKLGDAILKELYRESLNVLTKNTKSDMMIQYIWGLIKIYREGGLYVHSDFECLKPIKEWDLKEKSKLLLGIENPKQITRRMVYAEKGNLKVKKILEEKSVEDMLFEENPQSTNLSQMLKNVDSDIQIFNYAKVHGQYGEMRSFVIPNENKSREFSKMMMVGLLVCGFVIFFALSF
jgi:hypothetical protein